MAQCPHCGGYRVTVETAHITRSGVEFKNVGCNTLFGLGLGVFILICGGAVISNGSYLGGCLVLLLGIAIIVGVVMLHLKILSVATGYKYECLLCGKRWILNSGDDQPSVTVRPDLIARGEQRLEEERQQAAYQRRMAEWNYWQQQQNKNS